MRPFQFITELKLVESIQTLSHLMKINDVVYGLVPWTEKPLRNKFYEKLDNHSSLNWLYVLFKENRIGGWCGLNVDVLQKICRGYEIPYKSFNYGFGNYTHIVGIMSFKKLRYLFDPYFNKYYTRKNKIITFNELMLLIKQDRFNEIQPVYGRSKKALIRKDRIIYRSGEELEKEVLESFVFKGMNEKLLEKYGNINPYNLMKTSVGGLDGF